MKIDLILKTLNRHRVDYLLIGGMNFLLNHSGPNTFDIDFFVRDTTENRVQLNLAVRELACEWGPTEESWKAVPENPEWLMRQSVFCLTSPHGAIDIFRAVKGLEDGFEACYARAILCPISDGESYCGLCDEDMLKCQEALPLADQKAARVAALRSAIEQKRAQGGHP